MLQRNYQSQTINRSKFMFVSKYPQLHSMCLHIHVHTFIHVFECVCVFPSWCGCMIVCVCVYMKLYVCANESWGERAVAAVRPLLSRQVTSDRCSQHMWRINQPLVNRGGCRHELLVCADAKPQWAAFSPNSSCPILLWQIVTGSIILFDQWTHNESGPCVSLSSACVRLVFTWERCVCNCVRMCLFCVSVSVENGLCLRVCVCTSAPHHLDMAVSLLL